MGYTIVEDGTVINIIIVNQGDSSDTAQMIENIIKRLNKQRYQGGGSSGNYCSSQSVRYQDCTCNNCIHGGYTHTGGYGGGNAR